MDINFIDSERITEVVKNLCIDANKNLPGDICCKISAAACKEESELGRSILQDLSRNIDAAKQLDIPVCQDTGMAVVFAEVGNRVIVTGDTLSDAVNKGVSAGYTEGLLRCSVVGDPLKRINTGDNTPAVLHVSIVEGDSIKLTVAPKGFGSENMSGIRMLTPAAGRDDIINTVVDFVRAAGSNPCPPVVVGVGIGGDFEYCAMLAKKALCRSTDIRNPDPFYAELENDILTAVNNLGIGPQGFGGSTTAICVNIEKFATHIAGLPVAVNMGCHVTRHKTAIVK